MTTENTLQRAARFRLPDPPPRELDEVTAYDHVYKYASHRYLALHFGNPDTTLIEYDRWIVASPQENRARARRPDLLIAFNVSPQDYRDSNGYVISEQSKPPDFVLEVASASTADVDTGVKREDYASLGIPEYWRFDETGAHHLTRLAGDILEGDSYRPTPIEEVAPGVLQGYSPALNIILRWDHGRLVWIDPSTQQPILTYEDQENRADRAEARADRAENRADRAENRADRAEARARELEEELHRLRGEEGPS